jgi:predicted O-linked N-acetylglucosamine transferase (SPINDLY family)
VGIEEDRHLISQLGTSTQHISLFGILALEDAPDRHLLRSIIYAKSLFKQKPLPLAPKPSQKPDRLRIGYFSADFKEHPVSYLLVRALEHHNPERFEIYAYSFGAEGNGKMRQRIKNAVDVFVDVTKMSDHDIALLARQDKIDIAIDLSGYTGNSRTGIFAYRAAPIQISYLGYAGTMGADFIDYIIVDQTIIPDESQKFYSEKPIYMPHAHLCLSSSVAASEITQPRSELGLPEDGFVFCAINNTYKITPCEFDIWMRLLKRVDGSVLWLLESNKWAKSNLIKEAKARGISSDRLVFQPLMVADEVSQSKYLAQFRQADLYLDTFIYSAGSTAVDALTAGLPLLTRTGQGFSSLMAASLLRPLGLAELITTTDEDYERLALELSTNPKRLAALKQKLVDNLRSAPACDDELFAKHLENGYQQAYQQYFDGKMPEAIFVLE